MVGKAALSQIIANILHIHKQLAKGKFYGLANCSIRVCQIDDTGRHQPIQKLPQFCKFDIPTCRNNLCFIGLYS